MASVTDTVASTLAREAAKIGASKALGKPIDSVVDAIGDLGVAVIGDRSPGALGLSLIHISEPTRPY